MTSFSSLCVAGIAVPQTANSSSNLILQAVGADFLLTDPMRGIWKSTDGGRNLDANVEQCEFLGDGRNGWGRASHFSSDQ